VILDAVGSPTAITLGPSAACATDAIRSAAARELPRAGNRPVTLFSLRRPLNFRIDRIPDSLHCDDYPKVVGYIYVSLMKLWMIRGSAQQCELGFGRPHTKPAHRMSIFHNQTARNVSDAPEPVKAKIRT
jgi:hypothetical protein